MRNRLPTHIGVLLAAFASGCAEPPDISPEALSPRADEDRATRESGEREYRHPLLDAPTLVNGKIAVVDTIESSKKNHRYAMVHRRSIAEDGSETSTSGVVELRRELRTPKQLTPAPAPLPTVEARLNQRVSTLLGAGEGSTLVDVTIALHRPNETLTGSLQRVIASGAVTKVDDLHAAAKNLRVERQVEIRAAVDAVADAIEELGAQPGYRCRNSYCLAASVPADLIARVGALPGVERISQVEALVSEAGAWDAEDRSEVMQVNQFIDDGYDGEQDPATFRDDIWFGVIESSDYDDEHPAWDKDGVNWSRVGSRFTCDDGVGCSSINNFPAPDPNVMSDRHPTQVSALIFANLMENQDPNLSNPERHSGFARNALGRFFLANSTAAWDEVMDTIRGITGPYEHVVNMSQGGTIACNGDETAAVSVNSMFEDGTLLIKSAGNKSFNHVSPDLCKATTPGAAIGAFTVAGIKGQSGVQNMRSADIWYANVDVGSSVGGSENNLASGRGRTIVDLGAQAYLKYVPWPNSDYGSIVQGTSFAAPQVTGAAINFIDYFQDQHFNLEYEPGYLFTNLLLMGDREACTDNLTTCTTAKLSTRFDRRFGAGRARFRRFDGEGLDSPSHYGTGMIPCLGNGETVHLEVPKDDSFSAMEATVDDFKFVAWWYDRRHELTGTVANVDLRLYHTDGTGMELGTLLTSDDLHDNKERLYYDAPGSKRLVVEFEGTDTVPNDQAWIQQGCAAGEVNVYFAYFAEDDARDDFDGPTWVSPNGIEPESWTW